MSGSDDFFQAQGMVEVRPGVWKPKADIEEDRAWRGIQRKRWGAGGWKPWKLPRD